MATSTINADFILKRITKQYSVTIPNSSNNQGYVKIDDYTGIGVASTNYLVSMTVRGWSGAYPLQLAKSTNGTDIYVLGTSGSASFSVEYFFANPARIYT